MLDPHFVDPTESARQQEFEPSAQFTSSPNLTENRTPIVGKTVDKPSLILSIIGLVFSVLLPIFTYPCSIIALVYAITRRKTHNTNWALAMSVLSLVIAVLNSVLGVMMALEELALSY